MEKNAKNSLILNDFSPQIINETDCSDYIIDMTAFVLDPSEINQGNEVYSTLIFKFVVIVASRCSSLLAYSFDKIDPNSNKTQIYNIKKAHESRILCIKGFKPSSSELKAFKAQMPFCFITGGLEANIKIWEALSGKLLKTIEIGSYTSDLLIFQIGAKNLYINESLLKNSSQSKEEELENIVISIGPPKSMKIIDLELSNVNDIKTNGVYSLNSIESIGYFSKQKSIDQLNMNNYILFATVDKGSFVSVWKITRKLEETKVSCIKKIDVLMFWILSITSFANSLDPYKRKNYLAIGGLKGILTQKQFYITILDWKKSTILRTFHAHHNWINVIRMRPFDFNGKIIDCLISGSADEKACIWEVNSGKLAKEYIDQGDRVVMHGMRLFVYEENMNKKYFLVSGGHNEYLLHINIFKVWA